MTGAARTAMVVRMILGVVAILVIALALGAIAHRPELRHTFDATKTRAYSLSPQTRDLLGRLEGDWTIAMILASDQVDASLRRQVEEVLRRYQKAAPNISVVSVDPTDPRTLTEYERVLARVRAMEQPLIDRYEAELDAGETLLEELQLYSQQISGDLEDAAGLFPENDARLGELAQRTGLYEVMARDGGMLMDEIRGARNAEDGSPVPQYEIARSIMVAALSRWGDVAFETAGMFDDWSTRGGDLDPRLRRYARGASPRTRSLATRLVQASERLAPAVLPELQIDAVGRQLARGEAALVLGPDRAAVIPSDDLFPAVPLDAGAGAAAFDRRFRGEQVISSAIRSLLVDAMPMVTFVHAEPDSLLRQRPDATDVFGIKTALEATRFDVREWRLPSGDRPVPNPGQPVVYVVLPPIRTAGLDPDASEQALIAAVGGLLRTGEPVLLSLFPSLRPRYRKPDPWAQLARLAGVGANTGDVLLSAMPVGPDEFAVDAGLILDAVSADHPLARAVDGQRFALPLAIGLATAGTEQSSAATNADTDFTGPLAGPALRTDPADVTWLAFAEPGAGRWFSTEWAGGRLPAGPPPGSGLDEPAPMIAAVDRPHPAGTSSGLPGLRGRQRLVVVGAGGWMLSRTADTTSDLGNGRVALVNPGNQEFALASIAWLAGQDDLVSTSSAGSQVARLTGIDADVRTRWAVLVTLIAPAGLVMLGTGAWWMRRRNS
ncbi:MAG: Gldg family protein [Phycisphaerales bacterium]